MSKQPNPQANGISSVEGDSRLADLQEQVRQLSSERNDLRREIAALDAKNECLRSNVESLRALRKWGEPLISPEEVDRIMKEDRWVTFEEIDREIQKVVDQR